MLPRQSLDQEIRDPGHRARTVQPVKTGEHPVKLFARSLVKPRYHIVPVLLKCPDGIFNSHMPLHFRYLA